MADDPLIPEPPTLVTFDGAATVPVNGLNFRASPYAESNPFAAIKWRLGEVTHTNRPAFDPVRRGRYEIEPVWESAELRSFVSAMNIPAGAVQAGHTYRARVRVKDNTGRWSQWSEPVEFAAVAGTGADAVAANLRVTELMFNPLLGTTSNFGRIHNTSTSQTLDLNGVKFTQGIDYTFPAGATLAPGGYLLVIRAAADNNFAAFRTQYGLSADVPIFGPYGGALDNAGELVVLKAAAGAADVASFQYGDGRGWPLAADGGGAFLCAGGIGCLLRAEWQFELSGQLASQHFHEWFAWPRRRLATAHGCAQ